MVQGIEAFGAVHSYHQDLPVAFNLDDSHSEWLLCYKPAFTRRYSDERVRDGGPREKRRACMKRRQTSSLPPVFLSR
jgi:hypothetical protein